LLGESMGGAIVLSLVASEKKLPISGIILVAPAIWNFTEQNFIKSKFMKIMSKIFPNLSVDGKDWVNIRASDNDEMLKKLANDKYFVHQPNFKSLYGIIELMDKSFTNAEIFFEKSDYRTLLLIPIKDEIVPRKPLIELLNKPMIKKNNNKNIKLMIFQSSFHMMLRDLHGNLITNKIKDWILDKNIESSVNLREGARKLNNLNFFHLLD
tara:strand:+ start:932 stop:1561 length:630 start_codon:yes stop_codon:yes gene_type:complete